MVTTSTHRYPIADWLDGQERTIRRGDGVWPEYKKRQAMTAYLYGTAIRHKMRAHITRVDDETLTFRFEAEPAPQVDYSDVPPVGSAEFDRLEAENAELARQVRDARSQLLATFCGLPPELGPAVLGAYEQLQRGIEAGELPPFEEGGYRMRMQVSPGASPGQVGISIEFTYRDPASNGEAA